MTRKTLVDELINSSISVRELQYIVYVLVFAISLLLVADLLKDFFMFRKYHLWNVIERPVAILLAPLLVLPLASDHVEGQNNESAAMPADSVLTPSIAAAVLHHIVRRRREQIRTSFIPDTFSEDEEISLVNVARMADENIESNSVDVSMCHHPDVIRILEAVDRPGNLEDSQEISSSSYSIVIEVFGYPVVKNTGGEIAVFRKKKALELLTWLSLNRDRARRSTARTAMWEYNVTDATFSTILSDMRRSLFELDPTLGNCAPATYTDDISLSNQIVTDSDLLGVAYSQFKNNKGELQNVLAHLSRIRDIPFAGTAYVWADLDGTTTRLIIQVITICLEIAQLAIETRDSHALNIAIAAGLRVFPGHEELSEIQSQFLAETVQRGARSVA